MGKSIVQFIIFLFLTGCLPEAPLRDMSGADGASVVDSDGETPFVDDFSPSQIDWFHLGKTVKTLTVDGNNRRLGYFRGVAVENYLKTRDYSNELYCVIVKFNGASINNINEFRVRAVPDKALDFTTGNYFYFFRILLDGADSNTLCNKPTETDSGVTAAPSTIAYNTSTICTSCTGIIESAVNEVKLYLENSSGNLKQVQRNILDTNVLNFRVDLNQNSDNDAPNSCSDAECSSKGFDCCLEGQCVNNGQIKIGAQASFPEEFAIAEAQKLINPESIYNYPNIYYLCLNQEPVDPGTGDQGNPIDENNTLVTQMFNDYECLVEMKANTDVVPFHLEPFNASATYTKCNTTDSTNSQFYENVLKRVYKTCGCAYAENLELAAINLSQAQSRCPAYEYNPIYEGTSIARIECVSPEPSNENLPFQDLDLVVPSKSAPHRFFNTSGEEINLDAGGVDPTTIQEGDPFQYLDDTGLVPLNGSFNMNSIIGQFNIDLSGAYPAKQVSIEFDKTYYIAALPNSGQVSLCANCGRDSWFQNFTAHSTTSFGTGLQSVGYTTKRDEWGTNTTLGNYGDTHFGRACYLPPTMLAFSHAQGATTQAQRLNRLKTQAALYANGYRKDWYGFNQGALIGSFDGVSWFAVGKGRIVRSTSDKLYLAINAPMADLSLNTNLVVAIQEYDGTTTAARWDYDPALDISHPEQNEAASCREFHACEVDSDCITQLGWEYACVDINNYQTNWPSFSSEGAVEQTTSVNSGPIYSHTVNGALPPSQSSKQCVYRGAGAICQKNAIDLPSEDERKAMSCAPNFYCAGVQDGDPVFNTEISRYNANLEEIIEPINHLYGQDAFVAGRPKHYITGSSLSTLPSDIANTILQNMQLMNPAVGSNAGVCRPGKRLPNYSGTTTTSNFLPEAQHLEKDNENRTDYISQIAGCNSALYTDKRYSSCPMINDQGDYFRFTDQYLSFDTIGRGGVIEAFAGSQNACGLDSLDEFAPVGIGSNATTLEAFSPFAPIEKGPLDEISSIFEPTLARDACLRKAGAVCHSDLDCSPNKLHASVIDLINPSFFGNRAELEYWSEPLVCGQANDAPFTTNPNYDDYDITQNRCCRPIGEDITMYTEDMPGIEFDFTQGLRTDRFGGYNPNLTTRYSRFSNVYTTITDGAADSTFFNRVSANTDDIDNNGILDNTVNILNDNQWKTINEAGEKTCCGGGWIRKFADGTHNWAIKRLTDLEVSNFRCLNYATPLMTTTNAGLFDNGLTQATLESERQKFCQDPNRENGGCAHLTFDSSSLDPAPPQLSFGGPQTYYTVTGTTNFWQSFPYSFYDAYSLDNIDLIGLDWFQGQANITRDNIFIFVPVFIPMDPGTPAQIATLQLERGDGTPQLCTEEGGGEITALAPGAIVGGHSGAGCLYSYNPTTRALRVSFDSGIVGAVGEYGIGTQPQALRISFLAPGTSLWEQEKRTEFGAAGDIFNPNMLEHRRGMAPGNYIYYLERLSKLEYLGIPQMTYEPIYCNTNYQMLMPGVFNNDFITMEDFVTSQDTFTDPDSLLAFSGTALDAGNISDNQRRRVATSDSVQLDNVFSPNEFTCCVELGGTTDDFNKCCSGYGVQEDGNLICKLPIGANLNVYFNKFVSSEGMSENMSVAPLVEDDFDERTGEPRSTVGVLQKLSAIGAVHCETGNTRRGGVFGNFDPEPFGNGQREVGSYFSITDSDFDVDTSASFERGFGAFFNGFRWNNHIYCDQ
jgi:hypothetical protein